MLYRANAPMLVLNLVMDGVSQVNLYVLTTGMSLILKLAVVLKGKVIILILIQLS